ncbi:uncharacterized protein LOC144860178 [Branchiostoma floridae x Branchiostoma japonicum]
MTSTVYKAESTDDRDYLLVSKMRRKAQFQKKLSATDLSLSNREDQKKRIAEDDRLSEDEEERMWLEESDDDDRELDHEEGATGGSERVSHQEGGVKKWKAKCSFSADKEERLAEFFSANPIFYDKSHPKYRNQQLKDNLMDQLAEDLQTTRRQIHGWFKHMRTAVGKLLKTTSGQTPQYLTARKKWQLQKLAFLKPHIVPRTYSVETTQLEEQSGEGGALHYNSNSAMNLTKNKPPVRKKLRGDDLKVCTKFLERPRPKEVPSKPPDERTAFAQWIAARVPGIPQDRWDDFQLDVMRLIQDYSRPRANPNTSSTALPSQ